jgi:D-threo-aldose 1-dehydrogenase
MNISDRRPLGTTGLSVTRLGFGGAPLGNMYHPIEERTAIDTVRSAFTNGIRLFDTAPLYGHGLSEHRIGEALRPYPRDDFVLSTKIGRLLKPTPPEQIDGRIFHGTLPFIIDYDYSYDAVMR